MSLLTVTFETNGGTAIDPQTVTSGEKATTPDIPTRAGWGFAGFWKEPDFQTPWNFAYDTVTEDTTIYVQWGQTKGCVDGDGNEYNTVFIGNQEWLTSNLRATKYIDGTDIPGPLFTNTEWADLETPAYCWYDDTTNTEFREQYGALYNWYVIDLENPEKINPDEWRVSTQNDWDTLKDYLIANGYNYDGTDEGNKISKALSSNGGEWNSSVVDGEVGNEQITNNSTGFTVKPGGYRSHPDFGGMFVKVYSRTELWSYGSGNVIDLRYNSESFIICSAGFESGKRYGLSIRFVRDAHTVTFNSNGGNSVQGFKIGSGDEIVAPNPPTREGYNFNGWYSDAGLTTPWDFSTDTVTADTTLYAGWVSIKCKIEVINSSVDLNGKTYEIGTYYLNKNDWSITFKDDIIANKENILIYFDQSGPLETWVDYTNPNYIKSVNYIFNNKNDFFFTDISIYGEPLGKLKYVTANKLLGREETNGEVEEISLGSGFQLNGKVLDIINSDEIFDTITLSGPINTNDMIDVVASVVGANVGDIVIANQDPNNLNKNTYFVANAFVSNANEVTLTIRGIDYSDTTRIFNVYVIHNS